VPTRITCVAMVILAMTQIAHSETAYEIQWGCKIGDNSSIQESRSVSLDSQGNAFVTGRTNGSLDGLNLGDYDAFLARYDATGSAVWIRQFGTGDRDCGQAVLADPFGNAYVQTISYAQGTGWTDNCLRKYDATGQLLWSQHLGTGGSYDKGGLAGDLAGNVYMIGYTNEGIGDSGWTSFLSKYNGDGNLVWARPVHNWHGYWVRGVAADSVGNTYVTGWQEALNGYASHLDKYDPNGNLLWTHEILAGASEQSEGVMVDAAGHVIVTGFADHSDISPDDPWDGFLNAYEPNGQTLWSRTVGASDPDHFLPEALAMDTDGNILVAGGSAWLGGGWEDFWGAFVSKYNPDGDEIGTQHVGCYYDDRALGIAADNAGNVVLTGSISFWDGPNVWPYPGHTDAGLVSLAIPEPVTLSLLALGGLAILRCRSGQVLRRRKSA